MGSSYCYRLTDKGARIALMFVLFHKRVCGPIANSLFDRRPNEQHKPQSKIETAYYQGMSPFSTFSMHSPWPPDLIGF